MYPIIIEDLTTEEGERSPSSVVKSSIIIGYISPIVYRLKFK